MSTRFGRNSSPVRTIQNGVRARSPFGVFLGGLATIAPVMLLLSGCVHPLNVRNISAYEDTASLYLDKPLVVGIKINGTGNMPEQRIAIAAADCLHKHNIKPVYPYSSAIGNNAVDVVAEVDVTSRYEGSGWNFLINFPGFLIFTPAWHGYVYKADYTFGFRLIDPANNSVIDKWEVPVHLNIRHADFDRTWTEVSWFEWGVIAFVGGICFIQYDDDVTPLVINQTRATLGEYLAGQLVQRAQQAKLERHAAVQGSEAATSSSTAAKALQELKELKEKGIITEAEYATRRSKYLEQL